MGASRTLRWADNLVATGEAAWALLRRAHEIAGRSLVVGDDRVGHALGSRRVDTISARDAHAEILRDTPHVVVDLTSRDAASALGVVRDVLDLHAGGNFDGELQAVATYPTATSTTCTTARTSERAIDVARGCSVWLPVLSEGCGEQLAWLHARLQPDEICPVLPFPARNPRRADDLLLEHRALLVDRLHVDLDRVVYAHEGDPFDLYRTLATVVDRAPAAHVVVSPTEPGLLALGACLASCHLGIPFVWRVGDDDDGCERVELNAGVDSLTCVWLTGEPYEPLPEEPSP